LAIEQYISSQEDVRFKLLGKLYFSYYMYPESEFVWLKPEDNFEIAAIEYLRKSMLMVVFDNKNGE
jgi:hypothetical protein